MIKPKILIFSRYQKKVNRGVETFVANLTQGLDKQFQVKIFPDWSFKVFWFRPDIIIPVNGGFQALLTKLYCLLTGSKIIVSGQAGLGKPDKWNLLLKPNIFVALTKRNLNWAKKYSWKSQQFATIPNGVDLSIFKPTGSRLDLGLNPPIIICVAGPESYKNVSLTIKAVSQLKNASLLLVGGSLKDHTLGKKLLKTRFLRQKFHHQLMPVVYRSCHVFTLASESFEAFGIAYLEALATGLPVVAPNDQQRRQILGKQAIYFDLKSPKSYQAALKAAINTKPKVPQNHLAKFSWKIVVDQYAKLCGSLLD